MPFTNELADAVPVVREAEGPRRRQRDLPCRGVPNSWTPVGHTRVGRVRPRPCGRPSQPCGVYSMPHHHRGRKTVSKGQSTLSRCTRYVLPIIYYKSTGVRIPPWTILTPFFFLSGKREKRGWDTHLKIMVQITSRQRLMKTNIHDCKPMIPLLGQR